MQSVLLYSEIIPTLLALGGIYFILTGGLTEDRTQLIVGVVIFLFAVVFPFVSLSMLM
ncbi:MAG: hypothetical protein IJJ11_01280 [Methanosphaera sp.]|nr:hypothetical protein [Methanosphaera sp.]